MMFVIDPWKCACYLFWRRPPLCKTIRVKLKAKRKEPWSSLDTRRIPCKLTTDVLACCKSELFTAWWSASNCVGRYSGSSNSVSSTWTSYILVTFIEQLKPPHHTKKKLFFWCRLTRRASVKRRFPTAGHILKILDGNHSTVRFFLLPAHFRDTIFLHTKLSKTSNCFSTCNWFRYREEPWGSFVS